MGIISDRVMALEGRWLMGRVIPHEFLKKIGTHLRLIAPGREDELTTAIGARAADLVDQDADLAIDGAAKGMLAMSAVVLAAYEKLRPELDDDGARTILFLQHVFGEVLKRSMEIVIEVLTSSDEPLDTLEKALRTSSAMYGSYFHFEFERPDPKSVEMRIERCFFRDFFARHDALLVTTVLCSWDAVWMQALDPAVSGLTSERSSLLSLGDDACRFTVRSTDDPLATFEDALDRRFIQGSG